MKKNIYTHYWILSLLFLFTFSCNDDITEETFDSPPALRIQERVDELRQLLVSQQGFKATYFTKDDERGGFTFYMQFNEDGSVRQTSDILNGDFDFQTSSYDVRYNVTTELVFTTRNHITEGTNPDAVDPDGNPVQTGTGYAGTNNFQYFSVDEDGVIYFRDVRNRNTASLTLTPTNFTDFDAESLASVQQSYQRRLDFNDCSSGTFSFMEITSSTGTQGYNLNYNGSTLFAEPRFVGLDGSFDEFDLGILFTENSILVSPGIEVDGELLEEFFLDETSETIQYVASQNGVSAVIGYSVTPVLPILGYSELGEFLILHHPFLNTLGDDWTPDLTNQCFVDLVNDLNASVALFDVTRIDLYDLNLDTGQLYIGSTIGGAFYDISKEIVDDKVYLTITGTTVPAFFTDAVQPLIDVIADPEGLYVDQPTTLNAFSNQIFTFTPASNTTIRYSAVSL
ncbi:DUF4302 domain-containing protein [Winogradskyella schleiferi]|uniref:DUF4302 domain-containing protein n=1 Tax=Winogradskyella schleiferi TaxID=2686078 RepID=UPI0015BC58FD|nr:DUF4302 domain-containing protein [Winogradskyella schleiferi]